jgi:hypothetical protein
MTKWFQWSQGNSGFSASVLCWLCRLSGFGELRGSKTKSRHAAKAVTAFLGLRPFI